MLSALYYVGLIVGKSAFRLCLKVSIAVSSKSGVSLTNYVYKISSAGRNHSYSIRASYSAMQLVWSYEQKEKDTRKKVKYK